MVITKEFLEFYREKLIAFVFEINRIHILYGDEHTPIKYIYDLIDNIKFEFDFVLFEGNEQIFASLLNFNTINFTFFKLFNIYDLLTNHDLILFDYDYKDLLYEFNPRDYSLIQDEIKFEFKTLETEFL